MADKMTPEQRHHCMSRIRSRDTKPEKIVRRWLWGQGYRYRLNVKGLPGRPDIVLTKLSTVVFVNGCFWHTHEGCDKYRVPLTNVDFWTAKFRLNRERDERNYRLLHKMGWYVLVVWECQLTKAKRSATLQALSVRLSQIFLETRGVKLYPACEEEQLSVAAESEVKYGN